MLRSFFDTIICLALLSACAPTDTDNQEPLEDTDNNEYTYTNEPAIESYPLNLSDNDYGPALDEEDLYLIEQVYGDMSKEEWEMLLDDLAELTEEELQEWLAILAEDLSENSTMKIASCSGYYGSRIGYGWFPYSSTSTYRNLWTTNCYFRGAQCGKDYIASFWMGPDYRGDQSDLVAYASTTSARLYLFYRGGYSGEIYQGGSYYNFYACWPWEIGGLIDKAQLKQIY
ncbi:MAG: hypothetical protein WC752_03515 [Patescibacteria group bacterium]|jgi:hypothetical protein